MLTDPGKIWDTIYRSKGHIWVKPNRSVSELAKFLDSSKKESVLDLGSGNGRHIIFFGRKGHPVTGIDISKIATKLSEGWVKKENLEDAIILNRDMQTIPFPDKYFKLVVSTNALHHNKLKNIKETVNEIYRVLEKEGLIFISVASTDNYKCGHGDKVEKNTYIPHLGTDAGVLHHFFTRKELMSLFGKKFKVKYLKEVNQAEPVGGGKYWHLLAKKK